jgi:hypothetical protein
MISREPTTCSGIHTGTELPNQTVNVMTNHVVLERNYRIKIRSREPTTFPSRFIKRSKSPLSASVVQVTLEEDGTMMKKLLTSLYPTENSVELTPSVSSMEGELVQVTVKSDVSLYPKMIAYTLPGLALIVQASRDVSAGDNELQSAVLSISPIHVEIQVNIIGICRAGHKINRGRRDADEETLVFTLP